MSKRTTFTTISPLPVGITRGTVIEFLHNHQEMIDLNPLVRERHPIRPPAHAGPEEYQCIWYSLTDKISYLPGDLATGNVTYTCAFHDLPNGLQTHCYAPAGLNIRDKWTINGSLPGEPLEPAELGIGAPATGLYIREDVDMTCNFVMTNFVKKTLKRSHAALVERLKVKAQIATAAEHNSRSRSSSSSARSGLSDGWTPATSVASATWSPSVGTCPGTPLSQMATSSYEIPRYVPTPSTGFRVPQRQDLATTPPLQNQHHHLHKQTPYFPPPPSECQQTASRPLYCLTPLADQKHYPPPSPYPSPQQRPQADKALYPTPLRRRQNSASSAGPAPCRMSVYQELTRSALQAQPSMRYRVAHPDYPQMNPYADEQTRGPEMMGSAGGRRPTLGRVSATLNGPFVAELEG